MCISSLPQGSVKVRYSILRKENAEIGPSNRYFFIKSHKIEIDNTLPQNWVYKTRKKIKPFLQNRLKGYKQNPDRGFLKHRTIKLKNFDYTPMLLHRVPGTRNHVDPITRKV